ncbi:ABC transporter substrate-binding protein [Arsenicicoccus sp. oral taxon 190]|nr:ABC transporter substrate-binding protein [Arsenicicoccus sp. oral taxon 190]
MPRTPRRVVSLVPSLTEAVAWSAPDVLVGATDWCTHPTELQVTRVRGTKNPDLDAIAALEPDLVVSDEEENRAPDLAALRERGIAVWTTQIRSVDTALRSIGRLVEALDVRRPDWLDDAHEAWTAPTRVDPDRRVRAVIPVWRRPWMHVGSQTYAGDVLRRLGVDNVLRHHPDRYPAIPLPELPPADLVILPDEPYAFAADDGPEAFAPLPSALVDGRALTWYGPAMIGAPERLVRQLRRRVGT